MTKNKAKTSDQTQKKNAKSKQGYEHSYYDQDLEQEHQNSSFGQGSQDALRHEMNHPENRKHEHQGRSDRPKQRNNLDKAHEKPEKYRSENEQNVYESENFIEDFENPYGEHSHRKPSSMYQDENYSQPGKRWDDDFDEDNFYQSAFYHHEDDENLNIHHRNPNRSWKDRKI